MMKYTTTKKQDSSNTLGTASSSGSLSSIGSHSTATTASSLRARRSSHQQQTVRFSDGDDQVHMIHSLKTLPQEHKEELWYEGRQMGSMRKRQMKELKSAQKEANTGGISLQAIDADLTWRGFEDIEGGWCRVEKSRDYTSEVVQHYLTQQNNGYTDPDELKRIAKGLSKGERQRVRDLGIADAKAVGMSGQAKQNSRRSPSTISGVGSVGSTGSKSMRRLASFSSLVSKMKMSALGTTKSEAATKKNASWSARSMRSKVAVPCS